MSFDQKFASFQLKFYDGIQYFFQLLARLFGYPNNPGILVNPAQTTAENANFYQNPPIHQTFWPPLQNPQTWAELIFGSLPKLDTIPRYSYESQEEGFYNFYIENYQNLFFVPDWLSEFLQIQWNLCLDISFLENFQETLFVILVLFYQLIVLRISFSWFLSINPYRFPWYYLAAAVDWTDELLQGLLPSILGLNLVSSIVLGMLGNMADSLNHLVWTMPFLPSEGEKTQLMVHHEMKEVLVFHYLPILWYRFPIPNEIRTFWFQQRPDILRHLLEMYGTLKIQFLPDEMLHQIDATEFLQLSGSVKGLETLLP